jgi:hypothetical protein
LVEICTKKCLEICSTNFHQTYYILLGKKQNIQIWLQEKQIVTVQLKKSRTFILARHQLPIGITLGMKINKKSQKRGIENGIEAPTPYPGAPRSGKVAIEHPTRHREAEQKLHNLNVRDQPLPLGPEPYCA